MSTTSTLPSGSSRASPPGRFSPYITHDLLCTQIARLYSNEDKKVYLVCIGDNADYDIASADDTVRIEVKIEATPIRTKAICLEFWNDELNKPSGVLSTRSNVWLHIVLEETGYIAYEFETAAIQRLAIEYGETKTNGRNARFKIVPLTVVRQYARRSFPFSPLSFSN